MKISFKWFLLSLMIIIVIGFLIPESPVIPVKNATSKDWNEKSFWHYPWGKSGTHKGIDIFAKEGTPVIAFEKGIIIYFGTVPMGGNVVLVLGPKWKLHYYAHLQNKYNGKIIVSKNNRIGNVGTTGNAKGKPSHLHFSLISVFPRFWKADSSIQGWKKMFFLNPHEYLFLKKSPNNKLKFTT